ncbi:MAG: polysaccharide deacetylase [Firmicutes bacterium]|nr:polysaccharide deacetylase [Bacillota bacterium]
MKQTEETGGSVNKAAEERPAGKQSRPFASRAKKLAAVLMVLALCFALAAQIAVSRMTAKQLVKYRLAKKVVFLTFDDGPSKNTAELLDILKKYNVKASFFVTALNKEYLDLIAREHKEGHTVGVHSYTHDYGLIYSSDEAFWDDSAKMNDVIEEKTGERAKFMSFPGGTGNRVSMDYNIGIMTRLSEHAADKGFEYIDWNATGGDSEGVTDTAEIYQNVIDGIEQKNVAVVLLHDSYGFTVAAVEDIIVYCLDRGYTLMPLRKGLYDCRQKPIN